MMTDKNRGRLLRAEIIFDVVTKGRKEEENGTPYLNDFRK